MAEIKESPILFRAPLVRALLAGAKTQTRRIVKLPHSNPLGQWEPTTVGGPGVRFSDGSPAPEQTAIWHTRTGDAVFCPYGQPGDRLWVRETWQHANHPFGPYQDHTPVFYRADYLDDAHGPDGELSPDGKYRKWRPSIHMPRTACRLVLEVIAVRVERLQAISDSDALAEGVGLNASAAGLTMTTPAGESMPRLMFRSLWEQINGAGAWDSNPWVWVVEFGPIKGGGQS
ncbi:hypothetical protein [Achromobacter pestifer]